MHPLVNYVIKTLRKQGKKWSAFFDDDAQNKHLSRSELIQKYRTLSGYLKDSLAEELYKMTGDCPIFSKAEAIANPDYDTYWLYEGLCGEKNIISGLPFFGISLTFVDGDMARVYVLFDPMTDDVFSTSEGTGVQVNNKRIRFTETTQLDLGFTNRILPFMDKTAVSFRMIGSLELEVAWLCSSKGQIGCYSQTELSPGLRLVIKEAGGSCFEVDLDDQKITLIGHKKTLIAFLESPALKSPAS